MVNNLPWQLEHRRSWISVFVPLHCQGWLDLCLVKSRCKGSSHAGVPAPDAIIERLQIVGAASLSHNTKEHITIRKRVLFNNSNILSLQAFITISAVPHWTLVETEEYKVTTIWPLLLFNFMGMGRIGTTRLGIGVFRLAWGWATALLHSEYLIIPCCDHHCVKNRYFFTIFNRL